jgi:hypothetical protein
MVLTLFRPWRLLVFPPWGFWFPWFWLPQWVGVVGVDSRLDLGCCYFCSILSSWHCSMDELDWLYSTVQNFGIVEQQRVEQNSTPHEDVGDPWVVEDQEMGNMDSVVVSIHKVHRKV